MGFRDTSVSPVTTGRADGTRAVVGNQGDEIDQEPTSGKQVIRRGAAEAQADIDIATAASPRDLVADGDFESGALNAGGAEALAGEIVDDGGGTFDIEVDWLNDDNEVVITHAPAALTNVSDVEFNLIMRSDRFEVKVKNNTGANATHGSVNAH